MDVDLSTELTAIPQALGLLQAGADIVAGSRLSPQSHTRRCLKREIISRAYNRIVRTVLGTRTFDDAQCGFKAIRVETVRPLLGLVQDNDWFFDTELLVLAEYAGLTVRSLPVTWTEDPNTKVHIAATILQDLRGVVRLWRTARRRADQWKQGRSDFASIHDGITQPAGRVADLSCEVPETDEDQPCRGNVLVARKDSHAL
jgi:hypothetical protein